MVKDTSFLGLKMARSDLLVSLVKSATKGDRVTMKRVVDSLIAEERAKNHNMLADRLAENLSSINNIPTPNKDERAKNLFYEIIPQKTLNDLMLPSEVDEIIKELIEEQHRSELLRSFNLEPRSRILLAGPPGNGKTSLAEAIASHLIVPMVVIRYETLIGSYLGETASRLSTVIEYVKTQRCVLFFDEFETIGKERGDTRETGEIKRVVSSLLMQVDSLPSYVVVIAASNHPELLDRAVWRRFQLRLELPLPKKASIEKYLISFCKSSKLNFGYSNKILSEKLYGYSYAEIEEFCLDVMRRSVLEPSSNNTKSIVTKKLKQWHDRYHVKKISAKEE